MTTHHDILSLFLLDIAVLDINDVKENADKAPPQLVSWKAYSEVESDNRDCCV